MPRRALWSSPFFLGKLKQEVKRFFPFLRWFPLSRETLKADGIAGLTVGLVLVPQSMAYAQLAGLPAHYGLYAAFFPVLVGALWGSSSQLATGPVAMVSLLTASALAPLAVPGSEQFIAFAILLALLVGIVQLVLGVFKLGVVINFISHPVIVGFTNAAAIIIALSQFNKLLGLPLARSEHFIADIWGVLQLIRETHLLSLIMGLSAFGLMWWMRKRFPKLPGVLVAVVVATLISWLIDFEGATSVKSNQIAHPVVQVLTADYASGKAWSHELRSQIVSGLNDIKDLRKVAAGNSTAMVRLNYEVGLLQLQLAEADAQNRDREHQLKQLRFTVATAAQGEAPKVYLADMVPKDVETDGRQWRFKGISADEIKLVSGGEVIGKIPSGLPSFHVPRFTWDAFVSLLSTAFVISLVGFMEAISIAKAMATKSKERIDPNQELIGQGLANIVGSLSQSFPSSGSFSRSAVNFNAGAVTGMSSVVTALVVLLTLLFLTPLLYHLPQAVLAALIMLAVVNLVNFKAMTYAWRAHRHDGIAAAVTFVATLAFAPHLDNGIVIGAGLAVILFLWRTMKPRIITRGHEGGGLGETQAPEDERIVIIRFDAALYFANVPYFEDAVLGACASHPQTRFVLILGDGINQLDASGEEVVRHLVKRLKDNGVTLVFSGMKLQVREVMERTGLYALIGTQYFFRTENQAREAMYQWITEESFDAKYCPLPSPPQPDLNVADAALQNPLTGAPPASAANMPSENAATESVVPASLSPSDRSAGPTESSSRS
ncbi:MAG: SulP family inorganic anion transporter [Burkholderiales bacterium]|nr:SulP family inorganic anion transporter [Burkholderiales bacterium]